MRASPRIVVSFTFFLLVHWASPSARGQGGPVVDVDGGVGVCVPVPDRSAILDVGAGKGGIRGGFLPSRMTVRQRDSISMPAAGLMLFNTEANELQLNVGSRASPRWAGMLTSAGNGAWLTTGNGGTDQSAQFIGTLDARSLAFRTANEERMKIAPDGNIGIGTAPGGGRLAVGGTLTMNGSPILNIGASGTDFTATGGLNLADRLDAETVSTADNSFAIRGEARGSTAAQSIGVWGRAKGAAPNTGTIGVLAVGNSESDSGGTNVALQISSGELAVGRTTQTGTGYSAVEPASSGGSGYNAQGPSGVVEIPGPTLDVTVENGARYRWAGRMRIVNRYVSAESIILVDVVEQSDGPNSQNPGVPTFGSAGLTFSVGVDDRSSGSFILSIDMLNETGGPVVIDGSTVSGSRDRIRVAYLVINPGR